MTTSCKQETMDCSQPTTSAYPSSGYPTPCSSAYDSRRGSIASMQSASSYAQSYSSAGSSFCSTQMPPTPHTSRETLSDDWMLTQGGVPLETATSQDGVQHESDDFASETWSNMPVYGSKMPTQRRRLDSGFVFMEPNEFNNAMRIPGSEPDGMMPASGDFRSAFDASLGPQPVVRALQPPAEIYPSPDIWSLQANPSSAYPLNAMTSGAYEQLAHAAGVNMNHDWSHSSDGHFGLPVLGGPTSTLAPVETFVDANERTFPEMHSDSFDDSMGSFDGYTTPSTSPCSLRYANGEDGYFPRVKEERVKEEHDPDFLDRKRAMFSTPIRRGSRRDKRDRGMSKRKLRVPNPLDTYYTHTDDGCQVEVQYQAGIQVDQKTGRYTSLTGETKKQRCRFDGCIKTFARPEHLKRHENTHSKEKPFACAVPKCDRAFSRNDNRKAHYETHLKMEMSGKKARNAAVSFEHLCAYIEQSESPEEARKMIEKLQNPKTKSKLLRRD